MKRLLLAASFLSSLGASAAGLHCSIHPKKGIADADLPSLAKVSRADAENSAESCQCERRFRREW